mgnify:CR=1 FL=1|jgi:hypothetical protein
MVKPAKSRPQSDATWNEAMRIARGTQRPGQTKDQTRLIAKGIQHGIEQYKKQQSAKARELDRNRKKVKQQIESPETSEIVVEEKENQVHSRPWLPWTLLVLSWLLFAVYWFLQAV